MAKNKKNGVKKWFLISFGLVLTCCLIFASKCRVNPPLFGTKIVDTTLSKIKLPDNFTIEIYASKIKNARAMSWGKDQVLFVGSREEGNLYAVTDENKDGIADEVITIASKLNMPTGVAYKDGNLYVSEINRILVFKNIDQTFKNNPQPEVLPYELPSEEHHGWKYLKFGPDGKLYVPVGAPCNICESPQDERFATIMRMDPDGKNAEIYARGVRNSVGFDWSPIDQTLYFTDNGRDWLGNDLPFCELNHAPKAGMNFGYPYCHSGLYLDPDIKSTKTCDDFTKPLQNLGPHVAPLGMIFYTGNQFPSEYKNAIFIAEHGSWNREEPLGYRVSMVRLDENGNSKGYEIFASGWLEESGKRWGRPADIIMHPDGSILVSDDFGDMIYKISYKR